MGLTINNLINGVLAPTTHNLMHGLILATSYSFGILMINVLRQNYELDNSLLFVEIWSALSSLIYGKIFALNTKSVIE